MRLAGQRGGFGLPKFIRDIISKAPSSALNLVNKLGLVKAYITELRTRGTSKELLMSLSLKYAGVNVPPQELRSFKTLGKYLINNPNEVKNAVMFASSTMGYGSGITLSGGSIKNNYKSYGLDKRDEPIKHFGDIYNNSHNNPNCICTA